MFNKLKQFKDVKDKVKALQTALGEERVEGSGGWGKVKVTVDGNQKVVSVTIDPSVTADPKLGDMFRDATNDAMEKIQKVLATKMKDLGGLDLAKEMQDMMKG